MIAAARFLFNLIITIADHPHNHDDDDHNHDDDDNHNHDDDDQNHNDEPDNGDAGNSDIKNEHLRCPVRHCCYVVWVLTIIVSICYLSILFIYYDHHDNK